MKAASWLKTQRKLRLALIAAATLFAACSGGASDNALSDNFVEALEWIPQGTPEGTFVGAIDVDKATADLGLSIGDCTNPDTGWEELMVLFGGTDEIQPAPLIVTPSMPFTSALNGVEPWEDAFGFNPCTLSAYATQDGESWVALPEVDHEAVESALTTEPFWSDLLTTTEVEGGTLFDWGGDESHSDGISPLRRFGQGGSAALVGERAVLWSGHPLIDLPDAISRINSEGSILDQANVAPLLETMGSLDVYAFTVSLAPTEQLEGGIWPYNGVAWGAVVHEGENTYVLALEHNTEAEAQDFIDEFAPADDGSGEPWSDQFTITESWSESTRSIFRLGPPVGGELQPDLNRAGVLESFLEANNN